MEGNRGTTVLHDGVKPIQETTFESNRHGVRVHAQRDSILDSRKAFGSIKVSKLAETMEFEGKKLQGVLQIQCLPDGSRFGAPLLLDVLVKAGDEDAIVDECYRSRYEVVYREHGVGGCMVFAFPHRFTRSFNSIAVR